MLKLSHPTKSSLNVTWYFSVLNFQDLIQWRRCKELEWKLPEQDPVLAQKAADFRIHSYASRSVDHSGDIALWYLPYVPLFLKHPNVKIIALRRKKTDCINSFVKWFGQWRHFPWLEPEFLEKSKFRVHPGGYDVCYPKYDFGLKSESSNSNFDEIEAFNQNILNNLTIRQGAEIYYDDYNHQIDALKLEYPDRIKICDSYEILNSKKLQTEIFKWLGLDEPFNFGDTMTNGHQTNKKLAQEIAMKYNTENGVET